MQSHRVLEIGLCALLAATVLFAGSPPSTVSPGDPSKWVSIRESCPTFRWSAMQGVKSYELVVYRIGEGEEDVDLVLHGTISGSEGSWTPSIDSCLEGGAQYAWSVRAIGAELTTAWSVPSLFEVIELANPVGAEPPSREGKTPRAAGQSEDDERDEDREVFDEEGALEDAEAAFAAGEYGAALALLKPLAEAGNPRAQNGLGHIYGKGLGVPTDLDQAVMWHEKAAEQDYGRGQYELGLLYLDGVGVAKDPAVGAIWMHKAASQGVPEAAFTLGAMYQKGEGVERNSLQAAEWYLRAAEQGHALAQHNLAQMYAVGEGVDQDEAEALRWERSAAEQGDGHAQYRLGTLYAQGQALPQDYDEAFAWIRKAAEQGYPLSFDFASGWRVGHYSARPNLGSIMEFVREGDAIESWQRLLTLQLFVASWGGPSPEATLNSLKAMREVQCPGVTQWEVIGQDATSILYEWRSGQCRGWPAQHEIAKIIYGKTMRVRIAYTAKTDELSSEERTEWVDRIGKSRTDQ